MGISKLNITAYHPQCDGVVERMNRMLKAMLCKHSAQFGRQWDTYHPGVQWAYQNMPHESTKEKPSFYSGWIASHLLKLLSCQQNPKLLPLSVIIGKHQLRNLLSLICRKPRNTTRSITTSEPIPRHSNWVTG